MSIQNNRQDLIDLQITANPIMEENNRFTFPLKFAPHGL
jgi:hypothetical protein